MNERKRFVMNAKGQPSPRAYLGRNQRCGMRPAPLESLRHRQPTSLDSLDRVFERACADTFPPISHLVLLRQFAPDPKLVLANAKNMVTNSSILQQSITIVHALASTTPRDWSIITMPYNCILTDVHDLMLWSQGASLNMQRDGTNGA